MESAGGTSSEPECSSPLPFPSIGSLTEPLTLEQLKLTWGDLLGTALTDEFTDEDYGQMFVYDTEKGSNVGIIAALNKAQLFEGDTKYETLLFNLTEEQKMHERRADVLKENHEYLHWEVIVDTKSLAVVRTFVFEKEINK